MPLIYKNVDIETNTDVEVIITADDWFNLATDNEIEQMKQLIDDNLIYKELDLITIIGWISHHGKYLCDYDKNKLKDLIGKL